MRISFNKEQLQECKRAVRYYYQIQKQSVLIYGEEFIDKTATANQLYKLLQHLEANEEVDYADDILDLFKKAFNLYLLSFDTSSKQGRRKKKYINQCIDLVGVNNGV